MDYSISTVRKEKEEKEHSPSKREKETKRRNFFFIIQRVKARAIPCPHQPPTRVITVLVAQGSTATPGATKQLLPPDRVFKRNICLYIPQIN